MGLTDPLCLGPLGIDPAESECEMEKVKRQICEEVGLMEIEKMVGMRPARDGLFRKQLLELHLKV